MAFFGSPRGWRLASSPAAGRCASRRGPGPTAHPPAGPARIMHRAASRLPPSCAVDRVPAAELEGSGRGSCIPQTPPGRREKPGPSHCAPSSGQCVLEVRLAMCPVCSTRQDRGPGSERHPHHSRPSPPILARSWAAAAANVSPETFGCSLPVSHLPLGPVTGHSASGLQPHPSAPPVGSLLPILHCPGTSPPGCGLAHKRGWGWGWQALPSPRILSSVQSGSRCSSGPGDLMVPTSLKLTLCGGDGP